MRGIGIGAVYSQLSITERRKIERWRHAKVPVDEMARVLKRCSLNSP
ncbi:helix-turn-helix domain-containing protein [Sulfitobacter sp. 20_GPM-1509m]